MVWVLVGVRGCVAVDAGYGLVTLLSLSVSVKDRLLHKTLGQSQTYYPKHVLGCGCLEDLLLSCRGFQLFLDRLLGFLFGGGGPCTALSPGLWAGAWSPSLDGDLDTQDRRVMGWSCLCLGYKRGVCFRGTQLGTLVHESPQSRYSLSYV